MRKEEVLRFMQTYRYAVQSSNTALAAPQSALIGFSVSDQFEVVFLTLKGSRKWGNLQQDKRISLVIGGWRPDDECTVQYEGTARVLLDAEQTRFVRMYQSQFPNSEDEAVHEDSIHVLVEPCWIRYSNYNGFAPRVVEFEF